MKFDETKIFGAGITKGLYIILAYTLIAMLIDMQ